MKKAILAATAAMAAFAMAAPASATVVDPIVLPGPTFSDAFSGQVTGNTGTFTDTFSFTLPGLWSANAVAISVLSTGNNDITFTSVILNGVALTITNSGALSQASGFDIPLTSGGPYSLVVSGTGNGSYGGNIAISAAIPEPATWAMMIAGIAAVGMTMRRRNQNVRVAFS